MTSGSGDRGGHLWPKDRTATSADDVQVAYTVRGPTDAPWVVLCAGYLCPDNFWWFLAPALARRYRVVLLNYRGVGASTEPRPPGFLGRSLRAMDYSIEKHAADVIAVMDEEGIDEAALVGHSMGCQVALEVYRELGPDRIGALVLATGPFTSPLETFYDVEVGARVFPLVYRLGKIIPEPLWRLVPMLGRLPGSLDVAQLVRAIGPHTPRGPMQVYLDHFVRIDAGVGLRVAQAMHRHDASDLLPRVEVPTQVIVGTKDTFSPPHLGEEMAERVPDAELVTVDEATHCALLEFPSEVNHAIGDFLDRRFGEGRDDTARAAPGASSR